jgi:hypothetical protein
VLLVGTALSAMPYAVEVDGIYYNCIAPNTLSVTYKDKSYNSYSGDIVIPASLNINGHYYRVTAIDSCAFKRCTGLTSVQLPGDLTTVNYEAFAGCTSLREIDIPYDVTTIGAHAFEGCTKLTGVYFPEGLTTIGIYAFSKCSSLTRVDIPDNVTMLGGYAFSECSSLTTVKLSKRLNAINDHTFYICRKLTSIVIPNQVSSIGYAAFQSCSSMTSVVLGSGVTKLEDKAFRGCYALQDITCYRDGPPTWEGYDCFADVNYTDATLHVRLVRIDLYREATGWKKFQRINEIPYEHVDKGVYFIQTKLTGWTEYSVSFKDYNYNSYKGEVNIPEVTGNSSPAPQVVMILHDAFRNCDSLTSVSMGRYIHTIKERAFLNCPMLKEVNLSNQITTINDSAFAGCSALTSFRLPNSIKTIGHDVFSGCTAVETLIIPETVSSLTVDNLVMAGMTSLQAINCYSMMPPLVTGECFTPEQMSKVTLYVRPSSLLDFKLDPYWGRFAHIETWTFDFQANGIYYIITSPTECAVSNHAPIGGSYTSSSITIPEKATYAGDDYKVTAIGKGAFLNCPKVKTVTIPQSVTTIEEQAFKNSGLTSIVFPSKVTTIDKQAFMGCTGLTSLTIPNHIYAIEDSAFCGCYGLTSLDLGKSVTFVSNYAFAGCYNLSKIFIPRSVEALCVGAFQDCTNLKDVTIDMDHQGFSVDSDVFRDCYSLEKITCLAMTPPELDNQRGGLDSATFAHVTLQVPHSRVNTYRNADVWGHFFNIMPLPYDINEQGIYYLITGENTVSISSNGYNSYSGTIIIPNSIDIENEERKVTAIEPYAFANCTELRKVSMSNSVTEIGEYAFAGSNLYQINLSKNITEIKNYTFMGSGLSSITIPDKVTKIGDCAFWACSYLHDAVLPEGLESIGQAAFMSAGFDPGYFNINFPSSLRKIGDSAFMGSNIHNLTFPSSIDSIPPGSFSMCMKLQNVTIPNSVKHIGYQAFYSNNSLRSINIPNSVKSIDFSAFMWCHSLDTVIIGSGIERIEDLAFCKFNEEYIDAIIAELEEAFESVVVPFDISGFLATWKALITSFEEMMNQPISTIFCMATTPPQLVSDGFVGNYNNSRLIVPQGCVTKYKNAEGWKNFVYINAINYNDVNGDGEVNIADVNCVINAICEEGTESPRFDSNHDGEINIADINAILDQILKDYPIPLQ